MSILLLEEWLHRMKYLIGSLIIGLWNFGFGQEVTALFPFKNNGIDSSHVRQLSSRIENELVKIKSFVMVERNNIDAILKEQKFQTSGCVDTCLIEVGKLLGATNIVTGSIGKLDKVYTISSKLINVTNGRLIEASNYDTEGLSDLLTIGAKHIALELSGKNIKNSKIISKTKTPQELKTQSKKEYNDHYTYKNKTSSKNLRNKLKVVDSKLKESKKNMNTIKNNTKKSAKNFSFQFADVGFMEGNGSVLFRTKLYKLSYRYLGLLSAGKDFNYYENGYSNVEIDMVGHSVGFIQPLKRNINFEVWYNLITQVTLGEYQGHDIGWISGYAYVKPTFFEYVIHYESRRLATLGINIKFGFRTLRKSLGGVRSMDNDKFIDEGKYKSISDKYLNSPFIILSYSFLEFGF